MSEEKKEKENPFFTVRPSHTPKAAVNQIGGALLHYGMLRNPGASHREYTSPLEDDRVANKIFINNILPDGSKRDVSKAIEAEIHIRRDHPALAMFIARNIAEEAKALAEEKDVPKNKTTYSVTRPSLNRLVITMPVEQFYPHINLFAMPPPDYNPEPVRDPKPVRPALIRWGAGIKTSLKNRFKR